MFLSLRIRLVQTWIAITAMALLFPMAHASSIPILPLGVSQSLVLDMYAGTQCSSTGVVSSCSYGGANTSGQIANGGFDTASVATGVYLAASASTNYGFQVIGPAYTVPVILSGLATANDDGHSGFGYDSIVVYTYLLGPATGQLLSQYFSTSFGCSQILAQGLTSSCTAPGTYSYQVSIPSNSIVGVSIIAGALGGGASATIDPTIVIDPSFANANQFSVVASDGVFPAAATVTPEPSSFALLGTGMLAVAGLIKRKLLK